MISMNSYKSRNFDGHLNDYSINNIPDRDYEPDSNAMHDRNRGVTHFYLPQEGSAPRIISDVEIAFSPDPSVSSHFSYEHRERLANRVVASHVPNGMTDDALADVVAGNASFERSEISRMGDEMFKGLNSLSSSDISIDEKVKTLQDSSDQSSPSGDQDSSDQSSPRGD